MKILHISNDYVGSMVHSMLNKHLVKADNSIEIVVYIGLNSRNRSRVNNISEFESDNVNILSSTVLRSYHKYLYKLKIKTLFKDLVKQVKEFNDISLISASTLCSDGAVAYELYKRYSIPYVVSIRDTDINTYFKLLKHYRGYFYSILENASKVIFISERYKTTFFSEICRKDLIPHLLSKSVAITNGVDPIYLENKKTKAPLNSDKIKILYTGGIIARKNIENTLFAIRQLRKEGYNIEFTAIGKGLNFKDDKRYSNLITSYSETFDWFHLKECISKSEMVNSMNKFDIYALVSHTETFGLVYVEALTQGLPIVYTKGQGFDGVYPDGFIGFSAKSDDINDIKTQIRMVITNYDNLIINIRNESFSQFDWNNIAQKYLDIYKSSSESKI